MKAIGINLHGKLCKTDSTIRKYLDLFAENMLDYVELAICAMGVVDAAAKLDRARFDTLRDIFGSYSLNYTMEVDVGNMADLADPLDQESALLTAKRFVDVAGLLGSKLIVFHVGSVPTGIDRAKGLQESYEIGLLRHRDYLIWIGGVSDYSMGIFVTELDKALEKLTWIRGNKPWGSSTKSHVMLQNVSPHIYGYTCMIAKLKYNTILASPIGRVDPYAPW